MPVAHDGGQNGFGYGDYLAAKEASEKARRGGRTWWFLGRCAKTRF